MIRFTYIGRLKLVSSCAIAGLLSAPARAQPQEASVIHLQDYLQVVEQHHPKFAQARAKGLVAQAQLLSAKGAYDPKLALDADVRPIGKYSFGSAGLKVSQLTPFWGSSVFAGYGLGWGKFPTYMGDRVTGNWGTFKAGVALPLLAGRKIDDARAQRRRRNFELDGQNCEIEKARLDLLRKAADVYWDWIRQELEMEINQELLAVAQRRKLALQRKLESGAIAAIVVLDNQRLIIDRESKVIEAKRKLEQSAVKMSLYWRDSEGNPVVVPPQRMPEKFKHPRTAAMEHPVPFRNSSQEDIRQIMGGMPAICALTASIASSKVAVELAKTNRLPRLDLQGYVARYLGDNLPVPPTNLGVVLEFSVPLGMRKATGKMKAQQSKLVVLEQKLRQERDQLLAAQAQARIDLRAASRQLDIAARKVRLSEDMAEAERSKFAQGASDLVLVNLRELALAKSLRDRVEAWANFQKSRVRYFRSIGRDPLGRGLEDRGS